MISTSTVSYSAEAASLTRNVTFQLDGRKVVGTLTVPDAVPLPSIVLILHGFSGNRHGARIRGTNETLFSRTAQILAEGGIASLRISTGGRGGSEGSFYDMTLERRILEALKAIEWILNQKRFDVGNISILGHSQGTLIAVSAAVRVNKPQLIKSIVLWAPQSNALTTYRRSMGVANYQKGINAEPNEIIRWRGIGGTTRAFKRGFFTGLANLKTLDEAKRFDGRLLVVTGKRDRWSTSNSAQVFRYRHRGETAFLEFDVGHRMGAQIGTAAVDTVAKGVVRWLSDEM